MPVFLNCGLCGRKAVDGFLSRYSWEHVELNPHGTLQACPGCVERDPDWREKLISAGNGAAEGPRAPYHTTWSSFS